MKVLWVTNVEINSIANEFGEVVVYGGWLEQTAKLLMNEDTVDLFIACNTKHHYFEKEKDGIIFFSFDNSNKPNDLKDRISKIVDCVDPDIIHIWGTEYIHTLEFVNVCNIKGLRDRVVISIQGLVSVCSIHYFAGIPQRVIHHRTAKEFVRPNLYQAWIKMKKNGENEKKALQSVDFCIGRTDWDLACVKQINNEIKYYSVNEILRAPFYEAKPWRQEKCDKHTIFYSQANYPIKGVHYMLKALEIIKRRYSDVVLKVLGPNPLSKAFSRKIRRGSYEKYLGELIISLGIKDNIQWLGTLNAEKMVRQYLSANVFVCASSIENSSNSIAEAMLLGVPIIASDVGGIKSFLTHEQEGIIFHNEAYYMIADAVFRIFENEQLASELGKNARERALVTQDRNQNMRNLLQVYQEINDKEKRHI